MFLAPSIRGRLPRVLIWAPLPTTAGIKGRKDGVRKRCSLWLGVEQKSGGTHTAHCHLLPGNWGSGTWPLGREPSAQAEPRGSQDVLGGWGLPKTWWEAEVRRKGHSFSLPFPQPSPVPGSQAPFSKCLVACLLSATLLDAG